MPKTNDGGATYAGNEGIVQHGAPLPDGRILSELDPERHLDGTLIEGEHPDREGQEFEQREVIPPVGSPNAEVRPVETADAVSDRDVPDGQRVAAEETQKDEDETPTGKIGEKDAEVASSLGSSSRASTGKTRNTPSRSGGGRQ